MNLRAIQDVLAEINYKDWEINAHATDSEMYLQVHFMDGGEPQSGRKWRLSVWMTRSEIVQTAFKAVLAAEEHEVREKFNYRGRNIFGPHFDVDALVALVDDKCYDVRVNASQGE